MRRLRQAALICCAATVGLVACQSPDSADIASVHSQRAELVATCGSSGVLEVPLPLGIRSEGSVESIGEIVAIGESSYSASSFLGGRVVLLRLDGSVVADIPEPYGEEVIRFGWALTAHGTNFVASRWRQVQPGPGAPKTLFGIDPSGSVMVLSTHGDVPTGVVLSWALASDGPRLAEGIAIRVPPGSTNYSENLAVHTSFNEPPVMIANPNIDGVQAGTYGDMFGWNVAFIGGRIAVSAEAEGPSGVVYVFEGTSGAIAATLTGNNAQRFGRYMYSSTSWLAVATKPTELEPYAQVFVYDPDLSLRTVLRSPLAGNFEQFFGRTVLPSEHGILVSEPTFSAYSTSAAYAFDSNSGDLLFRILDPRPGYGFALGGMAIVQGQLVIIRDGYPSKLYVYGPNEPPKPFASSMAVVEDIPASSPIATDPDGDLVTVSVLQVPLNGSVSTAGTYFPAANYFGPDYFVLGVSDGCFQTVQRITVAVSPVNDPPVAFPDAFITVEDSSLSIAIDSLFANDVDADSDPLSFGVENAPVYGTLHATNGTLTYIPAPNFAGTDYFSYRATDGQVTSEPATVVIDVLPVVDAPSGCVPVSPANAAERRTGPVVLEWLPAVDVDGDEIEHLVEIFDGTSLSKSRVAGNRLTVWFGPGTYAWRVAGVKSTAQGEFSTPFLLSITSDDLRALESESGCSCSVERAPYATIPLGLLSLLAIAVTLGRRGVAAADDSA